MAFNLKQDLIQIRSAALEAVHPGRAVTRYLRLVSDHPEGAKRIEAGAANWDLAGVERVLLVAAGKAGAPMAQAAVEVLGELVTQGIVITKYGHSAGCELPRRVRVVEAGHPTPDSAGLEGAEQVEKLLAGATGADRILFLVSGGASALMPLPAHGVALDSLQRLTAALLRSGAAIGELNIVRKHLDRLKGGLFAQRAAPAPVASLILSDVVGDLLDVIASGPTVPDPSTFAQAWAVLERGGLLDAAPLEVLAHLRAGIRGEVEETPKPNNPIFTQVTNTLVGSNRLAALAAVEAARGLGYQASLLTTFLEGEAREVGLALAGLAKGMRAHGDPLPTPACLVLGGETTVTVRGQGKGGRNQELALAAALALEGLAGAAVMALATDGSDGPTDAAGALVDGNSAALMRQAGFDPRQMLEENNAYPALEAAGALMHTGPTGTNVNDLLVVLVG